MSRKTPVQAAFLSTLSLRRATGKRYFFKLILANFYPRSPCGERPPNSTGIGGGRIFLSTLSLRRATKDKFEPYGIIIISIHALLAESDKRAVRTSNMALIFLSTLSLRRATTDGTEQGDNDAISIHALLAESDISRMAPSISASNFYPRSPCGERP